MSKKRCYHDEYRTIVNWLYIFVQRGRGLNIHWSYRACTAQQAEGANTPRKIKIFKKDGEIRGGRLGTGLYF